MGQKSKEYQEMDRAIGQWKQQLLDEAEDLAMTDLREFREDLAAYLAELKDERQERLSASRKVYKAYRELKDQQRNFDKYFNIYAVGFSFLGGAAALFVRWAFFYFGVF